MNIPENSNYSGKKIVFLFGSTAVGKTGLLQSFFSSGFEVVNADSVQVYKHLDIGSAKIKPPFVPKHHLIDILEPWESFNVASFIEKADNACSDILNKNLVPVISGGTAYYFKHFLYGLSSAPEADKKIREEVACYIKDAGKENAYDYLCEIDPVSAARINIHDLYRVSRAIEVYRQTGKPLSSFDVPRIPRNGMKPLIIGLFREKKELDERIKERVDLMFESGLTEEIKNLIAMGASSLWQSMGAIGYREFIVALEKTYGVLNAENRLLIDYNLLDLNEIKERIVMNSVHYAKRQNTFFKSFKDVHWVHAEDIKTLQSLINGLE